VEPDSGSGSSYLNFLAPAPTSRGLWLRNDSVHRKPETIILLVPLTCPTNFVYGTGTQISGSSYGSTIKKFLPLVPQTWLQPNI